MLALFAGVGTLLRRHRGGVCLLLWRKNAFPAFLSFTLTGMPFLLTYASPIRSITRKSLRGKGFCLLRGGVSRIYPRTD